MTRVDDIILRTADGARLAGDVYHPSDTPRGGVVVVHGFSATRRLEAVVEQARSLADAGYLVLTYDGRGHGMSDGECTLGRLEVHDVGAAVAHLGGAVDQIVTVGASMGALAVLSHAVGNGGLAGIVLVSIATSWRSVTTARGAAAALFTRTTAGRAYMRRATGTRISPIWQSSGAPTAQVRRVHVPVAIVHGKADAMVRARAALDVYRAASDPRRIDLVDGMGHAFQLEGVPAVTRAVEWAFEQHPVNR
ncbi:alpha/beta hydrolase [Mycobacterium hubeiense]|uniref:alpha/beta hydrolase n=1 Tax=Mycobacterium hubeiense TaxID=1867256 RepID=UPI0013046CEA|nr:alpha/beta fold hydrolase [Mycobacterium sp. QGD 101]